MVSYPYPSSNIQRATIEQLVGQTVTAINVTDDQTELAFILADGRHLRMCHYQDCCEDVRIEEIIGDLNDLLDSPVLIAEERVNTSGQNACGHETWTFYELATIKGSVTIRWFGQSNGYYSESVDLDWMNVL